ncbi:IS110 family transposase [Alicyclobacillus hesperidum subsp. aegles]|uniref:IS110 family transposase n=1 Tax=Alicyclobacillus hesperidum TaxID=89784 RepID=UPI00222B9047|nr:IS110 family transposase [Alicyclobacillus hesperidum]GLG02814.1 IS110 family transposase [Alicyclobacillus hesperidum subsp. aegles]
MYFVGNDIGKRNHEACIIDSAGQIQGKTLRFPNTQAGGQKLIQWMKSVNSDLSSTEVALEATGHYWLALHSFLRKHGIRVRVINPIQSDAFRNLYIRQTKNDAKDAFIIAEVLRFGRYTTTELGSDEMVAPRQLSRFRFSLVDVISDLKRQVISVLDMLFPEYEQLFSDLFSKTSSELLMEYTTPEEILAVDTEELAAFIAKHSRNRLGPDKAEELKSVAASSFGIDTALDAYRLQLRLLLQQIRFTEEQLEFLNAEIEKRLKALDTNLDTIPGIDPILAAAILGEIRDISRFPSGVKLVAFARIDPSVRQSGEFTGIHNRMSKRVCLTYDGRFGLPQISPKYTTQSLRTFTNKNGLKVNIISQQRAL